MVEFIQLGGTMSHIQHDIKHLHSHSRPRKVDTNILCMPGSSRVVPEPFGVVLVCGAWNYPYQTSLPPVMSAIAAGNAVVLKPSEVGTYIQQNDSYLLIRQT